MKIWQLNGPLKLEHAPAADLVIDELHDNGKAKAKIIKAPLSLSDMRVFMGGAETKYPLILGRFAVGQITEATPQSYMKKGDRVYLSDVIEDEETESGIKVTGVSVDGYYRDFVLCDEQTAYDLPTSVSDEAAFLIGAVAMAERIVDEADIKVGQHVLVLGGGLYSNILCQILIYHRAVPILVDNNEAHLERAAKSGIYYAFHNDDTLKNNLLKVTGGKLADAAVYFAFANKSEPSAIFPLTATGGVVTFASSAKVPLTVNLENAIARGITVKTVTEAHEFVSTAINILANKAVNYSEFVFRTLPEDQLGETLTQYAQKPELQAALADEMVVFKFII
jgi:threonine dehydrogenase-like Zn-dependent dehydrogenase